MYRLEENHIWQDLFNHLLRHLTLQSDFGPHGCCLANLIDNPCGILDVVLGRAFEQVVFGDAAEFAVIDIWWAEVHCPSGL